MALVRLDCTLDRGDCHCRCNSSCRTGIGTVAIPASRISRTCSRFTVDCERHISTGTAAQSTVGVNDYKRETLSFLHMYVSQLLQNEMLAQIV
jgi:hypothetical protein